MVKVSETASYDMDSAESESNASNRVTEFRQISMIQSNKRSKFVATIFCSRRPGYYLLNVYSFNFLITVLSLTIFAIEAKLAQNRISGTVEYYKRKNTVKNETVIIPQLFILKELSR